MRFFTSETRIKRDAKRLMKSLARHGQELKYTKCLDLMARLHGFSHFQEWKRTVLDGPLSTFDEDADDEAVEARFQHQECVMAEAGFAAIAGVVLDEVNPTGWRKQSFGTGEAFTHDAA
ncbi:MULTISPECIES: glyoxalase superfamily protein [unclassified Bradyrhizobium]|uniref:glyoxalase superfamily protein n=1 Tax=unclassified Bradyrhizobium TaxID=2631580 RepID=UPI0007100548|nr:MULTISPECIES: glyoxalase superfamily protein [unclassified Bradyrhizobium]KQT12900.1 hypothetical protein ASG57_08075 [Bradyrhizobium sp. Leaf396]